MSAEQWEDITRGDFLLDCGDLDKSLKDAAIWCVQWDFLYGTGKTPSGIYFSPNAVMTREQFITMCLRDADMENMEQAERDLLSKIFFAPYDEPFNDENEISEWARRAFNAAKYIGFLPAPENNMFLPRKGVTLFEADCLLGVMVISSKVNFFKTDI